MKAKTIAKLRKKILSKGYYEKRWEKFSKECERWNDFERWHCNSFFVGYERKEYNQHIYDKNAPRCIAQCNWYQKKVEDLKK